MCRLFGLLFLASLSWPAMAWNAAGHRLIASIAWQQLDPLSRSAIGRLLRQHPDLRNPTTGAVADRRFLFVADPNLQTFVDGAVTTAPDGHRILSLPLP